MAVPAQHGLGPDQEEVASPVPVEAADDEPEKLVTGAEAERRWQRRATRSCWRRSRFSRRRRWRLRKVPTSVTRRSPRSSIIGAGSPIAATSQG